MREALGKKWKEGENEKLQKKSRPRKKLINRLFTTLTRI